MSDYKCPLCGKDVENSEVFCRNCQEIAEKSGPIKFMEDIDDSNISDHATSFKKADDHQRTTTHNTKKRRKGRKKIVVTLISLIIILMSGASFGAYHVIKKEQTSNSDKLYWDECVQENSVLSYSKYLIRFPNGLHNIDAHTKINDLKEKDKSDWENLVKTNNITSFLAYLINNPNTRYKEKIHILVDSLSWEDAEKANTLNTYQKYLENAENNDIRGSYKYFAQEKIEQLKLAQNIDKKEMKELELIVESFFNNISNKKYSNLEKQLAPMLRNFFGTENRTSKAILDSMNETMKRMKIKSVNYALNNKQIEANVENNRFILNIPLVKKIVYHNNAKKDSEINVIVELDLNKKIESVFEQTL